MSNYDVLKKTVLILALILLIVMGIFIAYSIQFENWRRLVDEASKKFAEHWKSITSSRIVFPVDFRKHKMTCGFGYRVHPITGKLQWHTGIDLAVPCGTPVRMPFDGTVKYFRTNIGGKNIIIMSRDGKISIGISHLSSVVKTGSARKGEVVAYTGSSGRSTGCHVHLTMYYNPMKDAIGKYVAYSLGYKYEKGSIDPEKVLKELGIELSKTESAKSLRCKGIVAPQYYAMKMLFGKEGGR